MSLESHESAAAASDTTTSADLPSLFLAELQAEREPEKAEPKPEAPETTDPSAEEAPAKDTPESEAAEADDTAPVEEPEGAAETPSDDPAIPAPSGMSEEDRKAFNALTPEMKAWVSKQASAANADYTRKSTTLAEHKKQLDAGVGQVVQKLQQLDSYLAKFTDNDIAPPDPMLRHTDPTAYDEHLAQYMHAQHQKELAGKERQRLATERQSIERQQWTQYMAEQDQALREAMPELYSDKGPTLRKQILEYGQKQGYAPEQLQKASAIDVITLSKAQKYDAIQAAKKNVRPVPPPAPTTAKPGPAKAPGRPNGLISAVKALEEKPSRDNLAAAFLAEIRSEKR